MGQQNDEHTEKRDHSPLPLDEWLEINHVSEPDSLRVADVSSIVEIPVKPVAHRGFALLMVCAIAFFSIGYFSARIQPSSCPIPAVSSSPGSSNMNQME